MPVFLKMRTQSFQKVRKSRRERCKFVACEADRSALIGSYRSLTFAYIKPFPGLKYMAKEGRIGISESSSHGALFLEKMFCGLRSRTSFADVNK